jgi:hypothetical protein
MFLPKKWFLSHISVGHLYLNRCRSSRGRKQGIKMGGARKQKREEGLRIEPGRGFIGKGP